MQRAHRIIEPDPTDRLATVADHSAGPGAKHRQQALQEACGGTEHRTESGVRDPDSRRPRRLGRSLPCGRHVGQKAVADGGRLVDRTGAGAVVADR